METKAEACLSGSLDGNVNIRPVEEHIYSVLPEIEACNSYDKKWGTLYDWVACNSLYNRLVWGYSVSKFARLTEKALMSSEEGYVLDLGCGSLAFTAKTYVNYGERPVIMLDQSLKLLKLAKSRLLKLNKTMPENVILLHGDALHLPFKDRVFDTVISLNLLHVLDDAGSVLSGLKKVLTEGSKMYFTTLIKRNRFADRYLKMWENKGEVVARNLDDLSSIFHQNGIDPVCEINGNMAFVCCG